MNQCLVVRFISTVLSAAYYHTSIGNEALTGITRLQYYSRVPLNEPIDHFTVFVLPLSKGANPYVWRVTLRRGTLRPVKANIV